MSVARLQRVLLLMLIALATGWFILAPAYLPAFWVGSIGLLVLLGHAFVLAFEFALLWIYGTAEGTSRPSTFPIIRAWWGEVLMAPRVFCWRQPWRFDVEPDWLPSSARPGVLFVHGFFCNRGFWNPWLARLRAYDIPCVAVSLEPMVGSIDAYSEAIELAAGRLRDATGLAPVVIAHSMGGLAVRSWLAGRPAATTVRRVFTIGSPHRGTWLARFSSVLNGSQMRIGSSWLDNLAKREDSSSNSLFVCYYSNCDNIVFPASSATLPGADNRRADGIAHVHMAFHQTVMDPILSELRGMTADHGPDSRHGPSTSFQIS